MAMTEDEARRLAEAFNELNSVTASRSKEELEAARVTREFDMKVAAATTVVSNLAKTFTAYNRALYDGEKGAKAFAASTDAMANSIEALGAALAFLLPIGRIAKIAIAGFSLLAGEVVRSSKIFGEQADNVRSAFDQLAQAGLTGAEGMEGVFDQIQKFGLNIKDASHVAKLMGENAVGMSLFSKTTRDGYLEFNRTVEGLAQFRTEFRNLGLDQKASIDAAMGLRKQQQLLALGTKAQMDVSSSAVKRYVEETDRLTRITGLSRQQQEKAVEDALSNQAYGATIANLQDEGTDAAKRSINQFSTIQKILSTLGPELEKAGQDAAGGFIGASDRAGKLFQASGGKYQALVEDIQNKRITNDEELATRLQDVFQTIGRTEKMFRGQQQMMNADTFLIVAQEMRKAGTLGAKDLGTVFQEVTKTQKQAVAGDALLNKSTELLIKQQDEELKLQKDVQRGVLNYMTTITAVGGALNSLNDAARRAAEALGLINGSKPGPGGMPATGVVPARGAPGTAPKSDATVQAQTEVTKIQDKVIAVKTELENNKKAQTQAKADLQTVLLENKGTAEIATAKQKIADLAKQEIKIKENIVEQEKSQQTAQKKVLEQQRLDQQILYKAREAQQMVVEVQKEITSNKQGLATLRDSKFETEKDIAAREAKSYKTSVDKEAIRGQQKQLQNINDKITKGEKELGEKEKQLSEFQKTAQSLNKALPTAATETVNIDIDREKFAKVDRENFEKYEARKKELYDKELKEIEADKNLDARQRARLREKAEKMSEEAAAKEFAAKIKAAGAGQVTVTKAPAAPAAGSTASAPPPPLENGAAPAGKGAPAAPAAPADKAVSVKNQSDLAKMGFKIKQGDVQAEGAAIDPKTLALASQIQNMPNFAYFSSFNDKFHQEQAPTSLHTQGKAVDFALATKPSKEEGQEIVKYLKSIGASKAMDEYNGPSAKATGGHIHAEIPAYADGGIANTPQIAFVAEKGPEAMIPLVNGAIPINLGGLGGFDKFAGTMTQYLNSQSKQAEKLYARPTDMAAGLVKSSLNTEEGTIQSKLIDTVVSKVVGSIPGVKELGSILNIAETLQSDKISTAEKVLEIAKLLNPTVRMVSKLYDVYNKVDAVTTAFKAPEEPAVDPVDQQIAKVFESGFSELSSRFAKQTDTDLLKSTISDFKNAQFGLADTSEIVKSISTDARSALDDGAQRYEKMLSDALDKPQMARPEESKVSLDKAQVTRPEEPKFTELKIPLEGIAKQLAGNIPGSERVSIAKDFDQDVMNKLSEQKATPLTPTMAPPTDTVNFREMTDVMKQTASINESMAGMMAELVRQQQTSNDISNKMLRVAQN